MKKNTSYSRKRFTKESISRILRGNCRQEINCKRVTPPFNLEEFREWLSKETKYDEMYKAWKESGFELENKITMSKISKRKPLSLDNLQLTTMEKRIFKIDKPVTKQTDDWAFHRKVSCNKWVPGLL